MQSTKKIEEEKKPFEVFTAQEIKKIKEHPFSEELKSIVNNLILVTNNSMHNISRSWYKEICSSFPEENLEEKKSSLLEIKTGAEKYLETANKLQKPKEGMVEKLTLPSSNRMYEKHVSVYNTFWESCQESLFFNFFLDLSKKKSDELSQGLDKTYVYLLLKIKNVSLDSLDDSKILPKEKIAKLKNDIDKTIHNIHVTTGLSSSFICNSNEITQSHAIKNKLFNRSLQLFRLKKEFESDAVFAKYIHIRPAILLQYAQLFDYVLKRVDESNSFFDRIRSQHETILRLLQEKRSEIIKMLLFHEKLLSIFNKDDFIEILHILIENKHSDLLPTQAFFDFASTLNFQIAQYEIDDPAAPSVITHDELQIARNVYLEKLNHVIPKVSSSLIEFSKPKDDKIEILPTPEISVIKDSKIVLVPLLKCIPLEKGLSNDAIKDDKIEILPTQKINVIQDSKILLVTLPKCVPLEKMISNDAIYDFFIKDADKRQEIFRINEYQQSLNFLQRQLNNNGNILFFNAYYPDKPTEVQGTLRYIKNLIEMDSIFHFYQEEILSAKKAYQATSNKQEKDIFREYADIIEKTRGHYKGVLFKIMKFWINQFKQSSSSIAQCHLIQLSPLLAELAERATKLQADIQQDDIQMNRMSFK